MKFKDIFSFFIYGAATTLGGLLAHQAYNNYRDPVKKAKLKNKFKELKNVIHD